MAEADGVDCFGGFELLSALVTASEDDVRSVETDNRPHRAAADARKAVGEVQLWDRPELRKWRTGFIWSGRFASLSAQ